MAKYLTVHITDKLRDSWVEVDGERVAGVVSVHAGESSAGGEGTASTFAHISFEGVAIVDDRSEAQITKEF